VKPPRVGRERGRAIGAAGALMGVGFAFVLSIVLGVGGGYLLDRWLGTAPWLFLLGFILGFAAGVVSLYRAANIR
jgi:ATP synthase protein I